MRNSTPRLSWANPILAALSVAAFLWVVGILLDGWAFRLVQGETQLKQEDSYSQLQQCREQQSDRLDEYRWIDRDRDVVRLPIERAMVLMTEEAE